MISCQVCGHHIMLVNEKRAYSRGYNAGRRGLWPEHRPPTPPTEAVSNLMGALRHLRDAVDGELATLSDDDPWVISLGPLIDRADDAFTAVTEWLTTLDEDKQDAPGTEPG